VCQNLPAHDFFDPQPVKNPAIFFLRVILHDWPDAFARRILLRLREAAREPRSKGGSENGSDQEGTKLIIGDFVLPLACMDDFGSGSGSREGEGGVEGVETMLARPPLLANLGKGSAMVYWMDLTVRTVLLFRTPSTDFGFESRCRRYLTRRNAPFARSWLLPYQRDGKSSA
jgi:hypothetical protein